MADPLSATASFVAVLSMAAELITTVKRLGITGESGFYETIKRIQHSVMVMSELFLESGIGRRTTTVHGGVATQITSHFTEIVREMQDVVHDVEKGSVLAAVTSKHKRATERLIKLADKVDASIQLLFNFEHTLTLRRIEDRLDAVFELSGQTAAGGMAAWDTIQSIEKKVKVGANEEEELAKVVEKWDEMNSDSSIKERGKAIEAMRDVLRITLGGRRGSNKDPTSFPFVIPVPAAEEVQARVKLDTGSRPNWISSDILRKAGISYEVAEGLGHFIGASRDSRPFQPLGRASVTWFSTNQALSRTDDFLVHDPSEIPCDVILGHTYIFNDLTRHQISEPVLQIRQLITKEQIQEIETQAKADGASNTEVMKLHSEVDKLRREEKRRIKAATRAASRALTPVYGPSPGNSTTPVGVLSRGSMVSVSQISTSAHQRLVPTTGPPTETMSSSTGEAANSSSRGLDPT